MKVRYILNGKEVILECREVYYKDGYLVLFPLIMDDKIKLEINEKSYTTVLNKLYNEGKVDCRKYKASVAGWRDYEK